MSVVAETTRRPFYATLPRSTKAGATLPRVADWEATHELHCGRWSDVFLAKPLGAVVRDDSSPDYVLKIVKESAQQEDTDFARNRIAREIIAARAVSHPHVVTILAGEVSDQNAWLVQPYGGRQTLRHYVEQAASLPQMLWLVRQSCEGLAALHAAGWLHGDVSPENVVVSNDGHATLIDLAFARRLHSAECLVAETLFAGRVDYAPPEAFASEGVLTSAADMYSLGVVLFELLVGQLPFAEQRDEEVVAAKKLLAPPDIRTFEPESPFGLANLVSRLLAREPLRRPTAAEAIEYLVALEVETFVAWR